MKFEVRSMSPPELWMYCTTETRLIDEHMYHTLYLVSITIDRHAGSPKIRRFFDKVRSGQG